MNSPVRTIVVRNLLRFSRDRMRLFMTLFMSGLFLFVFSFVARGAGAGIDRPMNYLVAGIVVMTVFQTALNGSMSILEDVSGGFMKEILVAPVARWEIAVGQILSSMAVSVAQGLVVLGIGFFLGLRVDFVHGAAMVALLCLIGATFGAMGLYLATLAKESANFQLLVVLVSFPLTFLSGAYIPSMVLPKAVLPVVLLNPLTYTTSAFRFLALGMERATPEELVRAGVAFPVMGHVVGPVAGVAMILAMGALFLFLSVRRFSGADFSRVRVFKRHR